MLLSLKFIEVMVEICFAVRHECDNDRRENLRWIKL